MKKLLLLLLIIFPACSILESPKDIEIEINQIKEKNSNYELSINIFRSDLYLKQSTFLNEGNKLKSLQINETPCEIGVSPNICVLEKLEKTAKLIAVFEDVTFEKVIALPNFDFGLDELIIEKGEESDDKSALEFKDIFADSYEIILTTCKSEDFCTKMSYFLNKNNGHLDFTYDKDLNYSPTISFLSGQIRILFDFDPKLFSSISYEIIAEKTWTTLMPNIVFLSEKNDKISF